MSASISNQVGHQGPPGELYTTAINRQSKKVLPKPNTVRCLLIVVVCLTASLHTIEWKGNNGFGSVQGSSIDYSAGSSCNYGIIRNHTGQADSDAEVSAAAAQPKQQVVRIMYSLKGNKTAFFDGFEISLKSVLMNSPTDFPMEIHFMVDPDASHMLTEKLYNATKLLQSQSSASSKWRNPITLHTHLVSEAMEDQWRSDIQDILNMTSMNERCGMGSMYRLFAYQVLPINTGPVVYMDTDVVILADLQELWQNGVVPASRDNNYLFQIGKRDRSAGFLVINVDHMNEFWDILRTAKSTGIYRAQRMDDQAMLHAVLKTTPQQVGDIPSQWTTHMSPNNRKTYTTLTDRKYSSTLHFSGLYAGKFFSLDSGVMRHCRGECQKDPEKVLAFKSTWGLAEYYVYLPWEWALEFGASKIRPGEEGYAMQLEYHNINPQMG